MPPVSIKLREKNMRCRATVPEMDDTSELGHFGWLASMLSTRFFLVMLSDHMIEGSLLVLVKPRVTDHNLFLLGEKERTNMASSRPRWRLPPISRLEQQDPVPN